MISKLAGIRERAPEDLQHDKDLCTGDVMPAFFAEYAEAMDDDWLQPTIDTWDTEASKAVPILPHKLVIETQAAYALQRDVNHRYQQHVRIKARGYDQKFRVHSFQWLFALMANPVAPKDVDNLEFTPPEDAET